MQNMGSTGSVLVAIQHPIGSIGKFTFDELTHHLSSEIDYILAASNIYCFDPDQVE